MDLRKIIETRDYDCSPNRISEKDIPAFELLLGMPFGEQLKRYLLDYGYIGLNHIEMYGINKEQMNQSDMCTKTLRVHTLYPQLSGKIVLIADYGEDGWYGVTSTDKVFKFIASSVNEMIYIDTGLDLNRYIADMFEISVNQENLLNAFNSVEYRNNPRGLKTILSDQFNEYALSSIIRQLDEKGIIAPKFPCDSTVWVIDHYDEIHHHSEAVHNLSNYKYKCRDIKPVIRKCDVTEVIQNANGVSYRVMPKTTRGIENYFMILQDLFIGQPFVEFNLYATPEEAQAELNNIMKGEGE